MTTNADIVDLRDFYASPLGLAAARAVSLALTPLWRPISDERLVGLGYAVPYIDRFAADAERAFAFMPAAQGAQNWPMGAASLSALVGVEDLPLGDASVDRVLIIHALEFAENPEAMLSEVWRVLAPGGRIVIVAPHRRGVWARFEHTPFGSGRPWSRGQLTRLLRGAMFTPSAWAEALLFPPFRRRSLLGFAAPLERLGRDLWPLFAGVVVIEATKQLYRGVPVTSTARERRRVIKPVLVPAGAGAGARRAGLEANGGE
ncbi:class I SAM-dependent methyltransferase [Aurantimonas sp. C2-6-R+9]|uniref:class I SAM-dependent methyltransferase n=1 Tax=unclassified Aurantimonas TaxID=2638230 RepID=UPI002E1856CB|nr:MULTISPECIES: class I SAM-dependent methyltransferase [unclassified Aurantimonas]MEC5291430.1 class I SAM-dependent methyltransferase [Aurantimonas sp. C2-3-R2]MEC5381694.1 class I SAM-dependent methyltransferase [Aurantimonas sp. C2-6-R+9]MEC5412518.1 class I SAM-dependent methyltransferase [Aurantimonas sp. C2-4-R8]